MNRRRRQDPCEKGCLRPQFVCKRPHWLALATLQVAHRWECWGADWGLSNQRPSSCCQGTGESIDRRYEHPLAEIVTRRAGAVAYLRDPVALFTVSNYCCGIENGWMLGAGLSCSVLELQIDKA